MEMSLNMTAYLSLLGWSEGVTKDVDPITQNDGYDCIVSGLDPLTGKAGRHLFTDYSDHPFAHGRPPIQLNAHLRSTASGRYQVILETWEGWKSHMSLTDFSAASQDAVAVALITQRGAAAAVEAGDIPTAVRLCSTIWASLPTSPYGQPTHSMEDILAKWQELTAA